MSRTIQISNIKKRATPVSNNKRNDDYSKYLLNMNHKSKSKNVSASKKRGTYSRKKKILIKDINEIERKIHEKSLKNQLEKDRVKNKKEKEVAKIQEAKKVVKKEVVQKEVAKKEVDKKEKPRSVKRSTKRKVKRKKDRSLTVVSNKLTDKNIDNIHKKINEIRKTRPNEIKDILEKRGVKVTGKSNRLLKDIYLYSTVCNINITHE